MRFEIALVGLLLTAGWGVALGPITIDFDAPRTGDATLLVDAALEQPSRHTVLFAENGATATFRAGTLLYLGPYEEATRFAALVGGTAIDPLHALAAGRGCLPDGTCDALPAGLRRDDLPITRIQMPVLDTMTTAAALDALGGSSLASLGDIVQDRGVQQAIEAAVAAHVAPFDVTRTYGSPEALYLHGIAQAALAEGHLVDVDWFGEPAAFFDNSVQEAAFGPGAYTRNPARWMAMRSNPATDEPDIGSYAAWKLMQKTGYLQQGADTPWTVILDSNYRSVDPNTLEIDWNYPDYPPGYGMWTMDGTWIRPNATNVISWHGDYVTKVGLGRPDNGQGVTGPGGATATITMVEMDYSLSQTIDALVLANGWGARVASLSYGWISGITLGDPVTAFYNDFFQAMRDDGLVVIAAAHNQNRNLDTHMCFGLGQLCVETFNVTPCEYQAVLCIAGTKFGDKDADVRSPPWGDNGPFGTNYGFDDKPPGTVDVDGLPGTADLYAPFVQYSSGSNLDAVGLASGTSGATPMVAGVAAMLSSVDHNVGAQRIVDRLLENAHDHTSPFPQGLDDIKTLDALDAVRAHICRFTVLAEIDTPYHSRPSNSPFPLVVDIDSGHGPFTVVWTSDLDGVIGTGYNTQAFLSQGTHVVSVQVTDACGLRTVQDTVTLHADRAIVPG